jgi:hypothetical protein
MATLGEMYQQRLGRQNLSAKLSHLLQKATRQNLPSSLERLQARLTKVLQQLDALPAPLGQQYLSIALTHLINTFKDRMSKLFDGGGDATQYTFRREWNRAVERFRAQAMGSRPRLKVGTKEENALKLKADRVIREATPPNSIPQRAGRVDEPISVTSDDEESPAPVKSETKTQRPAPTPKETFYSFPLEEIRAINETHAECGADPQMFPGARKAMKKISVQNFNIMLEIFLDSTEALIRDHIMKHTEAVFCKERHLPLYDAVVKKVNEYINVCCRQQYAKAMRMCDIEMEMPYTTDKNTSAKEAKRYKDMLQKARNEHRIRLLRALHDAEQIKSKTRRTELKTKEDALDDDEWDTEIELLANARAYHQIAASRFVDNVSHCMYAYTFPQLAVQLPLDLENKLAPERPEQHDQLVRWMSENPDRELKRNRLLGEQASLLEAQALVQETLGTEVKKGKRKAGATGDVNMGGSGTERESSGESPLKKTKFEDVDGMQPSVEDDMDES